MRAQIASKFFQPQEMIAAIFFFVPVSPSQRGAMAKITKA
jgi:hypothetical protein